MLRPGCPYDSAAMPTEFHHVSVLREEVVSILEPAEGKIFFDGTLGGAGHTEPLLQAGATVVATDLDPDALNFASLRLRGYLGRFHAAQASFSKAGEVLTQFGVHRIDGAVLDLGLSSHELATGERGFSFQTDGPLDMRMGPTVALTAAEIVNTWSEADLARIFRELGEENAARRVAAAIARERAKAPLTRTLELAACIERVIPRRGRIHPATRCFQAIRMAVNREVEDLLAGLDAITQHLALGARFCVITFESITDRIVKHWFRERATPYLDRPEWPAPRRNPLHTFRLLTPRAVTPGDAELQNNPRSRSAKLRAVERSQP
jgi:16S rRNA (cytosine1402-N4)-methyltransferase